MNIKHLVKFNFNLMNILTSYFSFIKIIYDTLMKDFQIMGEFLPRDGSFFLRNYQPYLLPGWTSRDRFLVKDSSLTSWGYILFYFELCPWNETVPLLEKGYQHSTNTSRACTHRSCVGIAILSGKSLELKSLFSLWF